ncbi:cobalt-precorrin-5B (C(1))-methyltransferase [Scytonema hofmannii PCC 7110]|uniref:Cobalt-precorrin-5B C(1)-methyltransferase n=1 Tax=Scytonema hofmannii PCC 7110 TaxID=128403 RepID=A0A139X5B2_9CYAN|nr:cobalt-precorrin-5B (C(1))-methyltransferase CbiD [Scytonema hofmannii]KYC39880.1 cobalt-precorrin-5B (C(1))-methyltransferase [Scytonema hofmannii PCC 7110]
MAQSGYTLPVFACASAIAALHWLHYRQPILSVSVDLIEPSQVVDIPVEQVAGLSENIALAIARSDPGDNLDITRNTPVWAMVEWERRGEDGERLTIRGGEGIGKIVEAGDKPAIYAYAQRLLQENLLRMLAPEERITVTIILPEGRSLALRTSNAAFGVVEGLSLLGTTGISQPLSVPDQLEAFRKQLQHKVDRYDCLVFCVGENGLDLAQKLGINQEQLVKTANWLGPMLVEAALQNVKQILLFGYHGKLIKLAGGIFHTHHHLADGRREILVAHCANVGLPTLDLQAVFNSNTAEAALVYLRSLDTSDCSDWVERVYTSIVQQIDSRSQDYIKNQIGEAGTLPSVGSVLFDRDRKVIVKSKTAHTLMAKLC